MQRRVDDENLDVKGERLHLDLLSPQKRDHRAVFGVRTGEGDGVRARIRRAAPNAEGAALEYEGLILDAGEVAEGLSPVTALPKLCEALRTAYVELAWTEGGESVASLVPEDELGLTLRLDGSGAPVSAEFTSRESGRTLITCRIDGFSLS